MKLRFVLGVLMAIVALNAAMAVTIESGKVYRIVNAGTPTQSMAINASGQLAVTLTTNETDLKQQWLVTANSDGSGYYLRNVQTGGYLKSPKSTSQQWSLVTTTQPIDDTMLMVFSDNNSNVTIRPKSHTGTTYAYAHKDGSNNVVCWKVDGSPNSVWTLVQVEMTDEALAALHQRLKNTADEIANNSTYQAHLDALFSDKACTQLKVTGDLSQNSHYQALPPTLRAMVDKVKSNNWAENSNDVEWDSKHSLKYRIQLYEPYSEGSAAAALAGIQAYTNMNNPTGILGDKDNLIYVMVNDPIPSGSTLYIGAVPNDQMYNSPTAGTPLQQGLNTILCNDDNSHYFIYYTVNTTQTVNNKRVPSEYKVTDFNPIKIHIEGGRLNGFFDYLGDSLYEADTQEDLEYTVMRASHVMYDLVGKYVILHLHLNDTPSQPGLANQKCLKSALITNPTTGADREYDPVKIMKAWDNMCLAERILMGIQSDTEINLPFNLGYYESIVGDNHTVTDGTSTYTTDPGFYYSDYLNNRMMGISQQGTLFMNATSWRTAFNVSTIDAILTVFCSGNIWGPAHEYGHMNQGPMNMAGTTEVSNNVFSNVAMYYAGRYTSRCEYLSTQQKNFQEGKTFLEAGTWGTTRMFWQLWCYYHATGHNKKFYPRLYQLLRQYPLTKTTKAGGNHNERYDMLHFAKMCCIAAEEDLTNFFTAWGFFVPLDGFDIDDYSQYNAVLTQEDIDAVKAEIKAFKFPKNDVILLIDDRPGSTRTSYPDYPISKAGELGGLSDFSAEGGATPSGNFSYTVDVNTVTVETDGTRGVGYLIYDENGELLGFYNTNTFEVTSDVAAKLMDGSATVKVMGEDQTDLTVVNPVLDGTAAQKRELLATLIGRCDELFSYIDESETRVGYLRPQPCETLQEIRNKAQKLIDNNSEDGEKLTSLLFSLSDGYNSLSTDPDARVQIEAGASYRITNLAITPSRVLTTSLSTSTTTPTAATIEQTKEPDPYAQQWVFEAMNDEDTYALRNVSNGLYLNIASGYKSNTILPLGDQPYNFSVGKIADKVGVFYIAPDNRTASSVHANASGNVLHYNSTSNNSQWTITKVLSAEEMDLRDKLATLIGNSEMLLNTAGSRAFEEPVQIELTSDCFYANAIQTTGGNAFKSWNHLIDNNTATYFCSDRSGADSADGLDHYIRVTAPANQSYRFFKLSFNNFSVQSNAELIYAYRIDASVDGERWAAVYSCNEGIDNAYSAANTSSLIIVPEGTKYLRFVVTKSGETKALHYSFLLSELRIANTHNCYYTPLSKYKNVSQSDMQALDNQIFASRFTYLTPGITIDELQQSYDDLSDAYISLDNSMRVSTGVENTIYNAYDDNVKDEYYELDGDRISHPDHGIYIHRHGNIVTKEADR